MAEDELKFHDLSDRELLVLACSKITAVDRTVDGHSRRLRSLENWRTALLGGWTALTGAVGVLAALSRLKKGN